MLHRQLKIRLATLKLEIFVQHAFGRFTRHHGGPLFLRLTSLRWRRSTLAGGGTESYGARQHIPAVDGWGNPCPDQLGNPNQTEERARCTSDRLMRCSGRIERQDELHWQSILFTLQQPG